MTRTHLVALFIVSVVTTWTQAQQVVARPRILIDFTCVAEKERACGMTEAYSVRTDGGILSGIQIPAAPRALAVGGKTMAGSSLPLTGDCMAYLIANPPAECVASVFNSKDVETMLAAAEARARKRERDICEAIATDRKKCPTVVVSN